jgi:hypothetical protein
LLLAMPMVAHGGVAERPPRWAERIAFWASAKLDRIRGEIQTIDHQLARLPAVAGVNTGNRAGYQSAGIAPGEDPWIEVELPAATPLDRVVLVPMLAKGIEDQDPGFGSPTMATIRWCCGMKPGACFPIRAAIRCRPWFPVVLRCAGSD